LASPKAAMGGSDNPAVSESFMKIIGAGKGTEKH